VRAGPTGRLLEIRAKWAEPTAFAEPTELPALLTDEVDSVLTELADGLDSSAMALVAIGGYGRGELCLHSDIDLMLLGEIDPRAIRAVLYPLWDSHLKVGHSVRTVREALTAAADNLTTFCSLLTGRLVWGDPGLLAELDAGLSAALRRQRMPMVELLAEEERRLRLEEPFFIQEMNVKTSRGGLRSLHRIDWKLRRQHLLGGEEGADPARRERRLLLAVRNALHAVSGRAHDRLAFDLREAAGRWLGRSAVDLCADLFQAARNVDDLAWDVWGDPPPIGNDPVATAGARLVAAVRGRWARPGGRPATALAVALRALEGSSVRRLTSVELGSDTNGASRAWSEADRNALVELLANGGRGWWAFRQLETSGWVGDALPEWPAVVSLPQMAPFHLHPVDSHLWRTVDEAIDITGGGNPWCTDMAEELGSIDELLLAAWLHDIGKGAPGDHSQVGASLSRALLARVGFGGSTVDLVSEAVAHHLLLVRTATREDLDDPAVIEQVARVVGDEQLLSVLALLTVADSLATGPGMWTEWTESLVRSLVLRVKKKLAGPGDHQLEELDDPALATHVAGMPPGYLRRFGREMAQRHHRLADPIPEPEEVRLGVFGSSTLPSVVVVTRDRPGLLATVAGVFSLHNLNVLEARVATRQDGVAIDSFRLDDALGSGAVGNPRWTGVRADLESAVRDEIDLEGRLRAKAVAYHGSRPVGPPSVEVRASEGVILTVRGQDRVGLLHDVARSITSLGVDIRLAKVSTRGAEVLDVFQLEPGPVSIEEIRAAVSSALEGFTPG
jgi:[protein-PII] uridylyltransferase